MRARPRRVGWRWRPSHVGGLPPFPVLNSCPGLHSGASESSAQGWSPGEAWPPSSCPRFSATGMRIPSTPRADPADRVHLPGLPRRKLSAGPVPYRLCIPTASAQCLARGRCSVSTNEERKGKGLPYSIVTANLGGKSPSSSPAALRPEAGFIAYWPHDLEQNILEQNIESP